MTPAHNVEAASTAEPDVSGVLPDEDEDEEEFAFILALLLAD